MASQHEFAHTIECIDEDLILSADQIRSFQHLVREKGTELYRDLPWRNTRDPYEIWISEVMLQQTQVHCVLGRWEHFMERFPTIDALASAASVDVVEEWQGMGYNRRALALLKAAQICSEKYHGKMPDTYEELLALPGIGPSTAAGICTFSSDTPVLYIETNVRAVILHHFFTGEEKVSDKRIRMIAQQVCPSTEVRAWYYALLDYGAYLKKHTVNPTRRAQAYTKQSAFEGSRRQKRAWIVREVMARPGISADQLLDSLNKNEKKAGRETVEVQEFENIMQALLKEGFFTESNKKFTA